MWAGDYRRFRAKIVQFGSIETESQSTKGRNWRALVGFIEPQSPVATLPAWLGREDSNLRMVESKSGRTFNEINEYSEKDTKFSPKGINRLAGHSE
jgi:hypothetical protein